MPRFRLSLEYVVGCKLPLLENAMTACALNEVRQTTRGDLLVPGMPDHDQKTQTFPPHF